MTSLKNGDVTDNGLVVSPEFFQNRIGQDGNFVDVFRDGCIEEHEIGMLMLIESGRPLPEVVKNLQGSTAASTFRNAIKCLGDRPTLGKELNGQFQWISWRDLGERAERLARIFGAKVPSRCFIGICARNCIEWVVAFLASVLGGFTVVPIHSTSSQEYLDHVVREAGLSMLFCDETSKDRMPNCVPVVSLDNSCELTIASLEEANAQEAATQEENDADLPMMVLYTSGSTGMPKGAITTDRVFNDWEWYFSNPSNSTSVHVASSPLSGSGGIYNLWTVLLLGGRIALIEDLSRSFEVLPVVAPTVLGGVPQFWNTFVKGYQQLEASEDCEQVWWKARQALGHRIVGINIGGAAPVPAVVNWLKLLLPNAHITTNYGSTEVGGITFSTHSDPDAIPEGTQVKLKDAGNYRTTDNPPRGEIWVKTSQMISGFLNRPDLTSELFDDDGFFCTGDLGEMPDPAHVRVIGRQSAAFKLSNGEWVSPESIESKLMECDLVHQLFIHGDSSHPRVVAVIVSDASHESLAKVFANVNGLRHFELPSEFHISNTTWSETNGLLTATGKINRPALQLHFANELVAMLDADSIESDHEVVRILRDKDSAAWDRIQWNSILVISAKSAIQHAFGVEVPVAALLQRISLEAVLALVHGNQILPETDWSSQTNLPEELTFTHGSGDRVFLTGSTGFVGSAVLNQLLRKQYACICCLVRAESEGDGLEKIVDSLIRRGYAVEKERLRAICGDLSMPSLGMDPQVFEAVARDTCTIINVGAEVNHLKNYESLRPTNVEGVRELLRFASIGGVRRFVQISTVDAERGGTGYADSKWVADELVNCAAKRGLDTEVLRLGMVGFSLRTGAANPMDWVMRYVIGCLHLGIYYCREGSELVLNPVDDCAEVIEILAHGEMDELPYVRLPVAKLMGWIAASPVLDRRIHEVSESVWQKQIHVLPNTNPMKPLINKYADGLPHMSQGYEDLEEAYSQESVDLCLSFLQAEGLLPSAPLLKRTHSNSSNSHSPFCNRERTCSFKFSESIDS